MTVKVEPKTITVDDRFSIATDAVMAVRVDSHVAVKDYTLFEPRKPTGLLFTLIGGVVLFFGSPYSFYKIVSASKDLVLAIIIFTLVFGIGLSMFLDDISRYMEYYKRKKDYLASIADRKNLVEKTTVFNLLVVTVSGEFYIIHSVEKPGATQEVPEEITALQQKIINVL